MATKNNNLSSTEKIDVNGADFHIGIVVSKWNTEITSALLEGCKITLLNHHVAEGNISIVEVPGAFELPVGAKLLAGKERFNAIICIGCVIKGDTKHDEYISNAVAQGIMTLSIASGKPIIFGVLTPNNMEQALERAGGIHGNKGVEAAITALEMAELARELGQSSKIGFNK